MSTQHNFKVKLILSLTVIMFVICFLGGNVWVQGKETITLRYWRHQHKPAVELEQPLIKKFEEQYPNIKVEMFVATSTPDLHEKVLVAFAGGGGPDLFNMEGGKFSQYVSYGLMVPIDLDVFGARTYQELMEKLATDVAAGLSGWKHEDKYYGLTTEVSCYATAINTQHFKEAGLDSDKDYPITWEKLAEIGQKLVRVERGEIIREAYALTTYPVTFTLVFEGMLRQLGGDVVSPDGKESIINSEAGVKALQTLYDFMYEYKITAVPSQLNLQGPGFETGATSIVTDVGPWYEAYLKDNAPGIYPYLQFKPFPRFEKGKDIGIPNYGYALQVSSNSKYKRESWELAKILVSTAGERKKIGLFVPDEWPWPKEISTGGLGIIPKEINDIVFEAATKTLMDKVNPRETLNAAKKKIDKYLAELPYKIYGYK